MSSRALDLRQRVLLEHVWQYLTPAHRVDLAKRALYDMPDSAYSELLVLRLSFMDLALFVADQSWPRLSETLRWYLRDATEKLADPVAVRPLERARV